MVVSIGLMNRIDALVEHSEDVFTLELLEDIKSLLELHKVDCYLSIFEQLLSTYNDNYKRLSIDELRDLKMKMRATIYNIQKTEVKFISEQLAKTEIQAEKEKDLLEIIYIEEFDKIRKELRYPVKSEKPENQIKALGEKDAYNLAEKRAKLTDRYKKQLEIKYNSKLDYVSNEKLYWDFNSRMKIFNQTVIDLEVSIQNLLKIVPEKIDTNPKKEETPLEEEPK